MNSHAPHPVVRIIEELGGISAVATAIGKRYSTASEMKRSRSIPVRYWPTLIERARKLGLPIDEKTFVEAHTTAEEGVSS